MSLAIGLLSALLAALPAESQHQTPKFTAETQVVNLSVTVTDQRGHYLSGLTQEDFRIYEDSFQQEVKYFQVEPVNLDVVLLLDTSASMRGNREYVRRAALAFVRSLDPNDHVAVIAFARGVYVACPFTSEVGVIEQSLGTNSPEDDGTHIQRAVIVAFNELQKHGVGEQRRRVVVLLTDGLDNDKLADTDWLLKQASLSDSTVYVVQLQPSISTPEQELHDSTYFLKTLTKQTGGTLLVLPRDAVEGMFFIELNAAFTRISTELRAQYRIGYEPVPERPGGSWRNISVHAAKGVAARYRLRYFAPRLR